MNEVLKQRIITTLQSQRKQIAVSKNRKSYLFF